MHTDSILEQWNIQEECNDIVNLCPDPFQLLVLGQAQWWWNRNMIGGGAGVRGCEAADYPCEASTCGGQKLGGANWWIF